MDECMLCQKIRITPNWAKFNEIFQVQAGTEIANRWLNYLSTNSIELETTHNEISICELHFNPDKIIRRTSSGEDCSLAFDALPIHFTIRKVFDLDLITKRETILKFKQFLNLHAWKYTLNGYMLKLQTKCGSGILTLNGLQVSATVHKVPIDVSSYTKARKNIDQWSNLRGLMKSIEDQIRIEVEVIDCAEVDPRAQILQSEVPCGWDSREAVNGVFLYTVNVDPSLNVENKALVCEEPIKFNGESSAEVLENTVKKVDKLRKRKEPEMEDKPKNKKLKSVGTRKKQITPVELPAVIEKPAQKFQCSLCPESYYSNAYLKRHYTRTHDETARKFQCTYCPRKYLQMRSLNRHVQSVHIKDVIYNCQVCDIKSSLKGTIRKHMLWEHTDSHYKCTCGEKLKHHNALTKHVKENHKVELTTAQIASLKVLDEDGTREILKLYEKAFGGTTNE